MKHECFRLIEYGACQRAEFLLRQGLYNHPVHEFGKIGLAKYFAQHDDYWVATGVYANKN